MFRRRSWNGFGRRQYGGNTIALFACKVVLSTAQLLVEQPLLDEYRKYKDKLTELAKRAQNMGKSMVSEEDLRLCEQWLNEERSRYGSEFKIQCYRATFDLLTMPDNNDLTPLHYAAASRDNFIVQLARILDKVF